MNIENSPVITFLNLSGDINITWDDHNKEKILELVRKKMKEGYVFFTTKSYAFDLIKRKVKINQKNIDKVDEIIITDEQFEKMCKGMNDVDVASLVRGGKAELVKPKKKEKIDALKKIERAEDVIDKRSVAIRPLVGG